MSTTPLPTFTTYLYSLQECAVPADWECGICSNPAPETEEPEDIADVPEVGDYPVQTACGHIFDLRCLYKWMVSPQMNGDRCPVCRSQLYSYISQYDLESVAREEDAREDDARESSNNEDSDSDTEEKRDDDKRSAAVMAVLRELKSEIPANHEWKETSIYAYAMETLRSNPSFTDEYSGGSAPSKFSFDWPHFIKEIMQDLHRQRQFVPAWHELFDEAALWIETSLAIVVVKHCFEDNKDWLWTPQMVELQEYFLDLRDMFVEEYC